MSIKVMTKVWDQSQHKGSALLLLLAMADCANDDGGSCYPSIPTLSQKTRLNLRTVRRLIDELIESGELELLVKGGGRTHSEYRIVIEGGHFAPGVSDPGGVRPPQGGLQTPSEGVSDPLREGVTPPEPSYNRHLTTIEPEKDVREAAFESFWTNYPGRRKTDKQKCKSWWMRNIRQEEYGDVYRGLTKWMDSPDWKKNNGEYIPMPYTWLNNRRWQTPPEIIEEEDGRWVG